MGRCRVVHLNANKILSWGSSVVEDENDDDSDNNSDNQQIDQTRETIFKEKDHGTEYFVPRLSSDSSLSLTYRDRSTNKLNLIAATTEYDLISGDMKARTFKFDLTTYQKSLTYNKFGKLPKNNPKKLIFTGNDFNVKLKDDDPHTKFLKMFNHEGRNLLFYRDDFSSKVASSCLKDYGKSFSRYDFLSSNSHHNLNLNGNDQNGNELPKLQINDWTSFVQTEMTCTHNNVVYKNMTSVGDMFKIKNENFIMAVFQLDEKLDDLIQSSIICLYKLDDIFESLSQYKFRESLVDRNIFEPTFGYKVVENPHWIYDQSGQS